jgi:quercetin dioxygenase-like cupin family protein/DNA-binding XRE family transcriptional regulator
VLTITEQLIEIGKRLFTLRDSIDISAEDMAVKLDVSADEYMAYERGENDFSVSFLYNAANILGVDVQDIIGGESPKLARYSITKNGKGFDVKRREAYDYKHLAYTFRDKKGEPFLVTIEPEKDGAAAEKHSHKGQEFCYILTGDVTFVLDDERFGLSQGDSVYFDSQLPHAVQATGGKAAEFIAVVFK